MAYQAVQMTEQLYFVRTSVQHFYSTGVGQMMPKLYKQGMARSKAKTMNAYALKGCGGVVLVSGEVWEAVPAIISYGKPLELGT